MSNKILEIKNLSLSFQNEAIIKDINLSLSSRETIALIGPSGTGKTTLLNLISGSLKPNQGQISKRGLWRRVHQGHSLLPWLTVEENIKLGTRGINSEGLPFDHLTKILDLQSSLKKYPRELSGGLSQRTEIARAIIGKPDGLLLDEPFASLDYIIRHETRNYLNGIIKEFPMAIVLVTHDIPEAISFTERTYVLKGRPSSIIKTYQNKEHEMGALSEIIWNDLK